MNLGRKLFLTCQYLIILKNRVPFLLMINMNSLLNLSGGYQRKSIFINAFKQKVRAQNEIKNIPCARVIPSTPETISTRLRMQRFHWQQWKRRRENKAEPCVACYAEVDPMDGGFPICLAGREGKAHLYGTPPTEEEMSATRDWKSYTCTQKFLINIPFSPSKKIKDKLFIYFNSPPFHLLTVQTTQNYVCCANQN